MKLPLFTVAILFASFSVCTSAFACGVFPNLDNVLPKLDSSMNVDDALNEAWKIKNEVRAEMKKDYDAKVYDRACSDEYKKFYIALRSYEDRVAVLGADRGTVTTNTAFTAKNPQTFVVPGQTMNDPRTDLQSGDIVLSRGNAYTSAAISHLGDSDQQFSHMSLVYKNPKTGVINTIESHIELGVIAKPLAANIKEMNSRDMVFRFEDQGVSARAAEYMFYRAYNQSKSGSNINYDFQMDMNDSNSLFCSEVASHAFDHASNGNVKIPLFMSSLTTRNVSFEHAIKVNQVESFLPGDIEIDPRFTLISEWKDWKLVRDLQEKDAILRSMLSWMDTKGYQFDQSYNLEVLFKKNVAWAMRRTPLIDNLVIKKMPLNMSRDMIGLFTVLDQVGKALMKDLHEFNDNRIAKTGILPTQETMMIYLDQVRQIDEKFNDPMLKRFHAN